MSQLANRQPPMPTAVQSLFASILSDLHRVEAILARELRSDSPFVDALLQYGGKLGGKRLRPALLLLSAQATGRLHPEHDVLAAVIEMVHTATLVHDDVLDEAKMRRHMATINARWNNETSILLGDYLFSHAFYLASTLDDTYACQRIGRSTNIVCNGELRQVGNRGHHALGEDEYFRIIDEKTAELCACACHLGARYACDSPDDVLALEGYGRSVGMAFQIADDLLDLAGDESATGKSLGTDLEKQKPTLPIIHCYQQANERERQELVTMLETQGGGLHENLRPWLARFDAIQYTRDTAFRFADEGRRQLDALPSSGAKDTLMAITEFVVERSL